MLVLRGAEVKAGGYVIVAIGGQKLTRDSEAGDTSIGPVTAAA